MTIARCFHCNLDVEVAEEKTNYTNNGRLRVAGKCSKCQTAVSRFVSDPSKPPLSAEEKKLREQERRELKKKEKESNPALQTPIQKKGKKRKIVIEGIELTILAQQVQEDGASPKRRKLTLKEKREKEIQELKAEREFLKSQIQELESGKEPDMPNLALEA